MTDVVVVIRLKAGEDVLAILHSNIDEKLKVEHPHFAQYVPEQNTVGLVPYCALSDETFYEISMSDVSFVVTAKDEVANRFFSIIDSIEAQQTQAMIDEEEQYDCLMAGIMRKTYIDGNNTKH